MIRDVASVLKEELRLKLEYEGIESISTERIIETIEDSYIRYERHENLKRLIKEIDDIEEIGEERVEKVVKHYIALLSLYQEQIADYNRKRTILCRHSSKK